MNYEIPPSLNGATEQQLRQIHSFLYRTVEKMNVELVSGAGGGSETSSLISTTAYTELRNMVGTNAKKLSGLDKDKVGHEELVSELEAALRKAEESGDFDGNGINYVSINNNYELTFGFTDGTYYTTPSLRGEGFKFEIGDVFVTTRAGDAAELLGYGTWISSTSGGMTYWTRTA